MLKNVAVTDKIDMVDKILDTKFDGVRILFLPATLVAVFRGVEGICAYVDCQTDFSSLSKLRHCRCFLVYPLW